MKRYKTLGCIGFLLGMLLSCGEETNPIELAQHSGSPLSLSNQKATVKIGPKMLRNPKILSLKVISAKVDRAEDGFGNTVNVGRDPVAIEIAANHWPVRALDPVLSVGRLQFQNYTFSKMNVLRYLLADRSLIEENAKISVQYGDDKKSLVIVAHTLVSK